MGTRHLVQVIDKGEVRVAQYGQWDGYPSGQGITILNFLRNSDNLATLRERLPQVRWITENEANAVHAKFSERGDGMMSMDESVRFSRAYPELSRDTGGKILEVIATSPFTELPLVDNRDFITEPDCEWAYTVRLDFDNLQVWTDGKVIAQFDLNNLPSDSEFLETCEERVH
jgi:hypothetical protein